MPSREQLGAAMRAAAQAGDHEAARRLAQAYNAMPTGGAGEMFAEQLQLPTKQEVSAPFTEHAPRMVDEQLAISGSHYRNLGEAVDRAYGTNLAAPPAPDDQTAYKQAVIDALLTTGGGAAGRMGQRAIGEGLRYLGRGGRTVRGLGEWLGRQPAAERTLGLSDLLGPVLSGTAVGSGVDYMDIAKGMGGGEFGDAIAGGTLGSAAAAHVAKGTIDDLLVGNPKWRAIMTSPSRGTAGLLLGAALGHLAAQGINLTSDTVNAVVDQIAQQVGAGEPPQPQLFPPGSIFPMPPGP